MEILVGHAARPPLRPPPEVAVRCVRWWRGLRGDAEPRAAQTRRAPPRGAGALWFLREVPLKTALQEKRLECKALRYKVSMSCSNHRAFIPMQTGSRLMAILSGQARPAIRD